MASIRKVGADSDRPRSKPHVERHARRLRKLQESERDRPRSFNEIMKAMADHDDASDDPIRPPAATHHASTVADLLVESGRFPHRTAALDHLLNSSRGSALLARLHKAADQTKEYDMRHTETLESILKDAGPVSVCKSIVARGRSPCGEHELVAALAKHAGGDRAFSRLFEAEESVRRACQIAKSAEFSVFDIKPVVVGGPDAMHDANDDDDSAVLRAHEEIVRIAREKFPFLPADQAFARVFEDKNYAALAAQAHQRPGPTTVYAMPRAAAYTKSDPVPNTNTLAYAELMLKAEAYRSAHPELSLAQCFAKIYTDKGNVELAKRERIESSPG
jgi:hypothetical protein